MRRSYHYDSGITLQIHRIFIRRKYPSYFLLVAFSALQSLKDQSPSYQSRWYLSVQFSSVAQSCLTHCDPMNRSTPSLPVHHQLPESTQTHVHWVHPTISSSVISFSCPQSFPASGSFPMSQLFASSWPRYWTFIFSISHFNEYSRLISFRIHWFYLLMPKGLSRVFSGTTVGKHRFFSAQPS